MVNIYIVSADDAKRRDTNSPVVGVAELLLAAEPHDLDLQQAAGLVLTSSPWKPITINRVFGVCPSQTEECSINESSLSTYTCRLLWGSITLSWRALPPPRLELMQTGVFSLTPGDKIHDLEHHLFFDASHYAQPCRSKRTASNSAWQVFA